MAGPVAKSNVIEVKSPNKTETIDMIIELKIIAIGEFEKTRAIAGGIISKEVINKTPTIWTETDTASAIKNIKSSS